MVELELKLKENGEKLELYFDDKDFSKIIEIDINEKKIRNLKVFFEDIIINSFLKEVKYDIKYSDITLEKLNAENTEIQKLLDEFIKLYKEIDIQ